MKSKFDVREIPRVKNISKEDFLKDYFKPQRPVVIEELTHEWPAYKKWSLDYISEIAGEKTVPLFDDRPASSEYKFNQPHAEMKMSEYIHLLKTQPTNYRIFLYNLLKDIPGLQNDFRYPELGLRFFKSLPFLFFGGEGAKVFMHFDIDYANIMHFHFQGKKRCLLFAPSETKHLYKIPYALISREDIDFSDPDFEKWPALKKAQGHIADLKHGEALYIPEGYWHYMHYLEAGFSMSLRAPAGIKNLVKAAKNIFFMRHFDNWMRKIQGQKWMDYKNERAVERTNRK